MRRIRLEAPKGQELRYIGMDTVHDAAIAMMTSAGVDATRLIGPSAALWGAAAVFPTKLRRGGDELASSSVVVSTTDPELAEAFSRLDPNEMRSSRAGSGEAIHLKGWSVREDATPLELDSGRLPVLCATPIAVKRKKDDRGQGPWLFDVREGDLQAAVNTRLSRLHNRQVAIRITPDQTYLASKSSHATFCRIKADKGLGHVIGLTLPLLLEGSPEDLSLAWYAGLGEKTRMGFGIVGRV